MNFLNWLVTSSADPSKLALTVKGLLMAVAPLLILAFGINDVDYGATVNAIVSLIVGGGGIISAVVTLYGLSRKITLGKWSAA